MILWLNIYFSIYVYQFIFVLYYAACPPPRPVNTLIIQTTAERKTGKFQNETKAILLFFMVDLRNYLRFLA